MVYVTDKIIADRRVITIYRTATGIIPDGAMVLPDNVSLPGVKAAYKYIYGDQAMVLIADLTQLK